MFGPAYSSTLLLLLYGPTWSATVAPLALAAYCLYILTLALNGGSTPSEAPLHYRLCILTPPLNGGCTPRRLLGLDSVPQEGLQGQGGVSVEEKGVR